ncbi:MAG: FAD-dependent oxidoreductase [Anaerolineae bacterium]|nr:FAD-dependent oxidoreductase [Anaerolineae bacterium]
MDRQVVVIGCGVSGLSCGIRLLEAGFSVTIIARDLPPDTTSDIAPAIWYPYKAYPQERVLGWAQKSLGEFYRLMNIPEAGVSAIQLIELYDQPTTVPWWQTVVRQARPAQAEELSPSYPAGYMVEIPLIESPIYLPYLLGRFQDLGGQIEQRTIVDLAEAVQERQLVVNCTGLAAGQLVRDPAVYPISGQIVRINVSEAQRYLMTNAGPSAPIYIFPRRDDCILGGTAEENVWETTPHPDTAEAILAKCRQLDPSLEDVTILGHVVGLRPGRNEVRLALEHLAENQGIIHNYGHGGAGFTLSWGCAEEVVTLAQEFCRTNR